MTGYFRIISMAVLLVCCSWTEGHAALIKAESQISAVTVYPDSVLVTRSAVVDVPSGEHNVSFSGIVPEIDENSLTVSGSGAAEVKLSGAYLKREQLQQAADERIKQLTAQIENISDQIKAKADQTSTLNTQKEFLQSVKMFSGDQIPKDLATKMPTTIELEGVLGFLGTQLSSIHKKEGEIEIETRQFQREKSVLERELNELRGAGGGQWQRSVVVNLSCLKPGKLKLNISYLVYGVSWYPLYDARASLAENKVELTGFGSIQQTTGEDWQDVELTLSTARPSVSGRLPYVSPWILRLVQPQTKERMMKVSATAPAATEQYEAYYLAQSYDASAAMMDKKADMSFGQAAAKGLSVIYKLPGKFNIKSDGTEHKFPVFSQTLPANFEYTSYPRLSSFAYLGSRVVNDKDLQLLAGRVNVFLEGDYVGSSSIDNIGPGEEFDLYLGPDENVKVERKEISKKVDDLLIAGIASPNRKTSFQYRLSVENYKGRSIKVILFEALPVAENDRIKTKVTEVSVQPKDKDWSNRAGIWRWEFELAPKAKQEVLYSFFVEHGRDLAVEGM